MEVIVVKRRISGLHTTEAMLTYRQTLKQPQMFEAHRDSSHRCISSAVLQALRCRGVTVPEDHHVHSLSRRVDRSSCHQSRQSGHRLSAVDTLPLSTMSQAQRRVCISWHERHRSSDFSSFTAWWKHGVWSITWVQGSRDFG